MLSYTLLLGALAMGFFGSPHCLGMCGGIVTAFGLSMNGLSSTKKRQLIVSYHLGRLTSYMLLGLIASILGAAVLAPFLVGNGTPRIVLGAALALCGLMMLGLPILNQLERVGLGLWQRLAPMRSHLFPLNTLPRAYGAGLLWGFLPCGLVYGALMVAVGASTGGISELWLGMLFMLFFGLGTLPMLLATQSVTLWLQAHIQRFSLRKMSGAIMLLSGIAIGIHPIMHMHASHAHHSSIHHPDAQHGGEHDHYMHSATQGDSQHHANHGATHMHSH